MISDKNANLTCFSLKHSKIIMYIGYYIIILFKMKVFIYYVSFKDLFM